MKALLLAGGLGSRLKPLTEIIPKPLVPLAGKPLLTYHLERLVRFGVTDVLLNTHHLPEKIKSFADDYGKKHRELRLTVTYEPELLGSAGTLRANCAFFEGEKDFLVVYGDNLTTIRYDALLAYHRQKKGICTIAAYYEEHPESKGIIVYDGEKSITSFLEKPGPDQIVSKYANAGIYACQNSLLDLLSEAPHPYDFGRDVFPSLINDRKQLYVYLMDEFLLDIGTMENYERAQKIIHQLAW